jgi:peptide/nickel transport system permease protein
VAVRRIWGQLLSRLAVWTGILLVSGLLAAALVRMAPGFGMDERLLDARLTAGTREAIDEKTAEPRNVLRYYLNYLARLGRRDFGMSLSLGRPVKELLAERARVSARSTAAGLLLAWLLSLLAIAALEFRPCPIAEALASLASGSLLCIPAAVVALLCVYSGAAPFLAIALILLPRLFRYARNLVGEACRAPHVLAAHAMGLPRRRILPLHVAAPVFADLCALAGVSVSMAVGATIPVEALCDSPGIGHLVWQAAVSRDIPVLVNVTLLIAAITSGANLLADLVRAPQSNEA